MKLSQYLYTLTSDGTRGTARRLSFLSALLCIASLGVSGAFGATITVTNTSDSGPGSLRNAIDSASAGDTIIFGVTGTITLGSSLGIGRNLTITGPGASSLTISGNNATQVLQVGSGVTATISGITITGANDTGLYWGGAILNFGTLTLDHIVANGNSAGAILNANTLTLINSTLSGNNATWYGGGIEQCDCGGTATVINSTISGNHANVNGGGIANFNASLTVINSTIANNTTSFYQGSGIYNRGTATLSFSTIWGNSGPDAPGIYTPGASFVMKNVIVANNSSGNCVGAVSSLGHNLSDDSTCSLSGSGDLNNTPAGLDPGGLQNNGGLNQTVALLPTSQARNAVPLSYCTDASGASVPADQRGVSRPQGPSCDIGSFELVEAIYHVCLSYDPNKAAQSGSTIPIKLQLCDGSGNDLSSAGITLHATSITQVSTSISGSVLASGNANPDNDFRFDSTLGPTGGYIFNLSTKGLSTGTYNLNFTVSGDSFGYVAPFQVK